MPAINYSPIIIRFNELRVWLQFSTVFVLISFRFSSIAYRSCWLIVFLHLTMKSWAFFCIKAFLSSTITQINESIKSLPIYFQNFTNSFYLFRKPTQNNKLRFSELWTVSKENGKLGSFIQTNQTPLAIHLLSFPINFVKTKNHCRTNRYKTLTSLIF